MNSISVDEGMIRNAVSLINAIFRNTSVYTLSAVTMRILWLVASQRSLHNAPIFRLLLKVAVNGTHQCDFQNFCGALGPQRFTFLRVGSGFLAKLDALDKSA